MAKKAKEEAPPPPPPPTEEDGGGGGGGGGEQEEEYDSDYYDSSDDDDYGYEGEDEFLTPEEREELEKQRSEKREERRKKIEEEAERKRKEEEVVEEDELWNFPIDKENWTEQDLGEHWEDYWGDIEEVGWDPDTITKEEYDNYEKLRKEGKPGPPMAPYYVPYRKFYPPIPDNHHDIQTPEEVVEELERMEEFLIWVSYVFEDGSSYEGTVWDDLAHGKGVYTTPFELCRYEGEWFQNMMEGHGVLEVTIPVKEPVPDTPAYFKAKQARKIMRADYMNPFDREWLKRHALELFQKHGQVIDSFDDEGGWVTGDGKLPPKGKYKYSGQWKHSRFHGCGVYEVNGLTIWGKFYFGEFLPYKEECSAQTTALHSSLAEVAAAKAKMFVNKPDGMVRETRGPFTDPSHPYMYEEEDLWMAPGFIHAYYEVPAEWKRYVEDLDKEREMWLNSFTKTPFTIPMPPELEYWWSHEDEFVVLGNTPSVLGDLNPLNKARARKDRQGEVLLHVPTGRIINWTTDKEGQLRFFYQPLTENGKVIPEAAIPLPLGFDEYMKDETVDTSKDVKKKNFFQKFKEAWEKTKEEYEQDRKNRREELEKKWKQEDEVAEIQRNLRRAEMYLAFQIEEEELLAKQREKEGIPDEEVDQEEEASQDRNGEQGGIEEADKAEQDVEESTYKGGEKDDDEESKKPKSFGKVAMVGIDGYGQSNGSPQEQGSGFPTAFASLSMGSKIVLNDVITSRFGQRLLSLLPQTRHKPHQTMNDVKVPDPTINFREEIRFEQARHYYHLRLAASCTSSSPKLCTAITRKGMRRAQRSSSNRRMKCITYQGIWSKPEIDLLSLAIPVKQ